MALRDLIAGSAESAAFQVAEVCAVREEADTAFAWMERAYDQRDPGLSLVKASRDFRALHDDPRWMLFLRKMGLEE